MATNRHILVAGHKNTDRGGAWRGPESAFTYPMANRIEEEIERRGGKAWVMQEEDGDGDPTDSKYLGLQGVARKAAELAVKLGGVDSILFVHYGAEPIDGFFSIYPDATGLQPASAVDVRGNNTMDIRLARIFASHIARTGMPIRGDGTMSETKSGVGWSGWRLGELHGSIGVREKTPRLIVEFGNSLDDKEYALLQSPAWQAKAAEAIVNGLEEEFGAFTNKATVPAPKPEVDPNANRPRTYTSKFDVYYRSSPGFYNYIEKKPNVIGTLKAGGKGQIIGGPKVVDGVEWYDVVLPGTLGTGWVQNKIESVLEIQG